MTHKELLGTWDDNISRFSVGETVRGVVRGVESYGIFVELAPNLSGLAELREGVRVGDRVSVFIKSVIPEKMKVKLLIIDILESRGRELISEADYYIREGRIERFVYTPEECREKRIETFFEKN